MTSEKESWPARLPHLIACSFEGKSIYFVLDHLADDYGLIRENPDCRTPEVCFCTVNHNRRSHETIHEKTNMVDGNDAGGRALYKRSRRALPRETGGA